jgi:hypothetical protein
MHRGPWRGWPDPGLSEVPAEQLLGAVHALAQRVPVDAQLGGRRLPLPVVTQPDAQRVDEFARARAVGRDHGGKQRFGEGLRRRRVEHRRQSGRSELIEGHDAGRPAAGVLGRLPRLAYATGQLGPAHRSGGSDRRPVDPGR